MRAESAITYASNRPDVNILDPARVETAVLISPMAMVNYLVGIIFGILIPLSIILFIDYLNSTIQSEAEVNEMTKLPVAGIIVRNKTKRDFVVFEQPKSSISESFRLLRTNLKFMLSVQDKRVIAVQSCIPGEGKSFVSINLATILAMNSFKVLLVGADMRMPSLKIFNSNNQHGLSTYLSKQEKFEDVLENTPIPNLSFVPAGPIPPNPAELLENGLFGQFISKAKSCFDYIILDSPPILLVTDGIIIGNHAEINLFTIRFNFSRKEHIKVINEIEVMNKLPSIAIILNDAVRGNYRNGNYYDNRHKGYYLDYKASEIHKILTT
jgi:capsular exopolysaccharide synthesis family protein